MIDQFPVPMILLVVGVLAFAALARNMKAQHRPSFEATPIMTPNEWEFFNRLSGALPECRIFPQVAMAALMKPDKRNDDRRTSARNMISQKRVDYAVYGLQKQLMCVVELDDRTLPEVRQNPLHPVAVPAEAVDRRDPRAGALARGGRVMRKTRDVDDRALRRGRLLAARSRTVRGINRRGILGGCWDVGSIVRGFMGPIAPAEDEIAADGARGDPANQSHDQPTVGDEA